VPTRAKDNQPNAAAFTGRKRARAPKKSVLVADRVAHALITLGGIGSIVAVSLVGLFLVYVVLPLFIPPRMPAVRQLAAATEPTGRPASPVVHLALNEYLTMGWELFADGSIAVRDLADGRVIARASLADSLAPSCRAFGIETDRCAFGYPDGTVRLGKIGFATEFFEPDEVPVALHALAVNEAAAWEGGVVQRTPEDQFRRQQLTVDLGEPQPIADAAIEQIDYSPGMSGPIFAALDGDGVLHTVLVKEKKNILTGETTTKLTVGSLDLAASGVIARETRPERGAGRLRLPDHLLVTGIGDGAFLVWRSGRMVRLGLRDVRQPVVVEEQDLLPAQGRHVTALGFQIGKAALVVGDDQGGLQVWYRTRNAGSGGGDGAVMAVAHELQSGTAAVTALAASARSRLIAAGYADGSLRLYHVTSNRLLAHTDPAAAIGGAARDGGDGAGVAQPAAAVPTPITALALAPRDDRLAATAAGRLALWRVEVPHPETSFGALLLPVWYEGYDAPTWVWQSSAATDSFEPKYSLVPLIFGTLKATFYAMLFGLPLALIAAIYTSEFLKPSTKAKIKPTVEMMASLPSVVLGFLAALVFAPAVERHVPEVLTALVTVPFALLLGGYLWQLLPHKQALRFAPAKFALMFVMIPVGLGLARYCGPVVERTLFAGDIMLWLDGQVGSGLGGWMFLFLPLSALLVAAFNIRFVDEWLRTIPHTWTRRGFGLFELGRFLVGCGAALAVALLASWLMAAAGWDPRGSFIGTYVQRNALVVGVVMGFAIIPIIYTLSEDALSAVPDHLRAASLGAGATAWQTASYVVIPTATSGLFSATMIGLGRAVGETMIVLMAAGNTPVLDWNIFNGFRTLAANLAVELPEAVQNSTHYRTLFLAALTLFAMTFVINSLAEAVRIRFRKKSLEL
jgi:phosphate transport system permease protein